MNHRHSLAGGAPGKRAFFPRRNPCPLANLPLHARCTTFSASLHHHWQRQFLLWSAPLPCVAPPAVDPRIVVRASRAPAVGRLLSTVSMSCLRSLALLMSSLSPCKEGKRAMTVCMQCVPRACVDWIAFFLLLCDVLNRAGQNVVWEPKVRMKWVCRNLNLAGTLAKCGEFVSALTGGKEINCELWETARTYGKFSLRTGIFFACVSACYLVTFAFLTTLEAPRASAHSHCVQESFSSRLQRLLCDIDWRWESCS